ncbi:MAG TPA: hypothetical protein VH643_30880 [Gemmataceae bacterium]|jgi:hypothetical protein
MATVRLESYDSEVHDLPEICMKCGAPSSVRKNKTFSWYPPWVGVLLLAGLVPYLIVAAIVTKRCRVEVPLCDQHKSHWLMRQLLVLLSLLGLLALGGVFMGVAIAASDKGSGNNPVFGFVCVGWLVLMVGWIVLACIVQYTTIRPSEITDTSIRLTSVSEVFVEACDEERPRSRARLDRAARERWSDGERRPRRSTVRPVEDFEVGDDDDRRSPPDAYREGKS